MLPTGYQFNNNNTQAPLVTAPATEIARSKSTKRKAEQVELEDDVYDGIKRLYSEESPGVIKTCGSEVGLADTMEAASVTYAAQVQPVSAN